MGKSKVATSVTCTRARRINGVTHIDFGKISLEFRTVEDARDYIRSKLGDFDRETLIAIALAKLLQTDPTGANINLMVGKTITADLSLAANLVRIT